MFADGGVVHTGTVGNGLVGIVEHVVFLRRGLVSHSSEGTQFKSLNHFPFQLALKFHIYHVDFDVVIIQFVKNVEWSVVADIIRRRVERTARIERVRIRVDIESA